ncbi:MAG TPA: hypothetical protein VKU94_00055, partial [Geobacterales bacterium]|nr:hypothetical protein [Geobacterales bacterium]
FLDKDLKPLDHVYYQLFAFYPSPSGTVFKEISNGFIRASNGPAIATIDISDLKQIAQAWFDKYGDYIHPSLIGFASYIENQSNSLILYQKSFTLTYDPLEVLEGKGLTKIIAFDQPKIIDLTKITKGINNEVLTTTTTSTTVTNYSAYRPCYNYPQGICYIGYDLNWVVYYPSQNSMGPIPLMEVNATSVYSLGYQNYIFGFLDYYMNVSSFTTLSFSISEGFEFKGAGISYDTPGPSITLSQSTIANEIKADFGGISPSTQDIYVVAQVALANFTAWDMSNPYTPPVYLGYSIQLIPTGLLIEKAPDNSQTLPVFFSTAKLYIPFNWDNASFGGYVFSGQSILIRNLDVTTNVLPGLRIAVPLLGLLGPLIAILEPPGWIHILTEGILANLDFMIQTSNISLTESLFVLLELYFAPSNLVIDVYYDISAKYIYNGQVYNVPTSIFYIQPVI